MIREGLKIMIGIFYGIFCLFDTNFSVLITTTENETNESKLTKTEHYISHPNKRATNSISNKLNNYTLDQRRSPQADL